MSDLKPIDQKLFERIEAYLDGQMDREEQLAFEVKMKVEPQLKQEVELERTLRESIEAGAMRDELEGLHDELFGAEEERESIGGISPWRIAAGIALILGVGALLFNSGAQEESLFADYATVDPGLPVPMSASDTYDFHDAMVDYKSGDYDRALMTWSRLQENDKDNDTLIYYVASAHFNKGEFERALPYFRSISEAQKSAFKDKALWYLGLSYVQLERLDDFKALTPDQTSVYRARIEEMKLRLNK